MCELNLHKEYDKCVDRQKKLVPECLGCTRGASRDLIMEEVPFWAYEIFRRMHNTDMAEGSKSSLQVATGKAMTHVAHTLHKVSLEGAI